jgi:hypothetical protein
MTTDDPAGDGSSDQPIQDAIDARLAELREAVRAVPEPLRTIVAAAVLDGAIAEVRRWASLVQRARRRR